MAVFRERKKERNRENTPPQQFFSFLLIWVKPVVLKYEMGNFGRNGAKWAISGRKGGEIGNFWAKWA